jgi:poly(hydroxyalkanoate) depolymerase family esterase
MAAARRGAGAALVALVALVGAAPTGGTFARGVLEGRAYRVWVPTRPALQRPLVVALHGCWQTPEDFALGTRLNDAGERRGLVVVYPAQSRSANPYRCWNWFEPAQQTATGTEPAQILAIARRVQSERGLGETRLVIVGFSAGAWMAVNLACALPDVVIGVGAVAGGPYRCASSPETAIQCMRGPTRDGGVAAAAACAGGRISGLRASFWQGERDSVVSASNLAALEAMFGRVLGVSAGVTSSDGGAVHAVYRNLRGPALETWLVPGMGHAWSGGDARATHTWPSGPSATERMLDFLLAAR